VASQQRTHRDKTKEEDKIGKFVGLNNVKVSVATKDQLEMFSKRGSRKNSEENSKKNTRRERPRFSGFIKAHQDIVKTSSSDRIRKRGSVFSVGANASPPPKSRDRPRMSIFKAKIEGLSDLVNSLDLKGQHKSSNFKDPTRM
jgi:hypothetical protein